MKTYEVELQRTSYVTITVEADNEDDAEIKAEDGSTYRAFVTHTVNPYGFPAKDRSGRLDLLEPPHLGALIAKCAGTSITLTSATTTTPTES